MPPSALLFIVCQALANQGPLDVNGWPADGVAQPGQLPQRDPAPSSSSPMAPTPPPRWP